MTIIFAQPRHEFGSYADLWQLITLSGFPLVYYDEIDVDSDNTYILTIRNDDIVNGFPDARARLVLWDLEYRREAQPPIPGIAEVWHMDKPQAELIGAKYVPIGGHPGLRMTDKPTESVYDVSFLAYMTHRRQHIYNQLKDRGVRLTPTSAWAHERDGLLNSSKVYLHCHQHDDIPAVPGLRMVVAAAYHLPFITEKVGDAGFFVECIRPLEYEYLAEDLPKLLSNPDYGLQYSADILHFKLCEFLTFRKSVEAAL